MFDIITKVYCDNKSAFNIHCKLFIMALAQISIFVGVTAVSTTIHRGQ